MVEVSIKALSGSTGPALPGLLVHADEHMLVLDKPEGMLCVPGRGEGKQDCLSARVQAVCADALVVHRLDMATSGLVLMARGAAMQRVLSQAFAERRVHKRYEAVVHGLLPAHSAWQTIELPLLADWPNRPRSKVDLQHGKPSLTRWRVVQHDAANELTRVALEPVTGRSHQLRVHLQAIGHPIVGDALYAPPPQAEAASHHPARLMLHATQLRLDHPATGQPLVFDSPTPF
ncbi:MAG: RluA family pseudouridine synthase [Burkholderiaceae bacterium]|jgi:tRNA pseudouridine32 synthase/23S rRNA pseudouridine746 synthase